MSLNPKKERAGLDPENLNRSQSLYRKWRSQTFGELVGQDAVTRTLKNAISSGRVGHAYLFCGPRGTGKTSTARLLAKAVNCTETNAAMRPCNRCDACQSIAEGRAMDLIEIDAASNRGIDEIRELRDKINFQPSQLRKKFYIIDEVHMLTEPAFNALLKTLEEPPPHAVFVLATTDPQDIPATVVSRCQRFDFQRINLEQIALRLAFVCDQESIKYEQAALELVARQATGSLRDALSLLDQLIVFSGGVVTVDAVRQMLGVMNSEAVSDFAGSLVTGNLAGGLEQINNLVQTGSDLKRFNRELIDYLRGMMLLKAHPTSRELLDLPGETLDKMKQHADSLDLPTLVSLLKTFSSVDYGLKVSPYAQLPLEIALMEALLPRNPAMAQPVAAQPTPQPAARVAAPTQAPVPQPAPRPVVKPDPVPVPVAASPEPEDDELPLARPVIPTPVARPAVKPQPVASEPVAVPPTPAPAPVKKAVALALELNQVQQLWPRLRETIGQTQKMIQALLADARPVNIDGAHIIIAFKYQFHREKVAQDKNRMFIEEQYSKLLGQSVYIRCVPEDGSGPGPNNPGPGTPRGGGGGTPLDERTRRAAQIFNAVVHDVD